MAQIPRGLTACTLLIRRLGQELLRIAEIDTCCTLAEREGSPRLQAHSLNMQGAMRREVTLLVCKC